MVGRVTLFSSGISESKRSEVETLRLGMVWWEADAHPVLEVVGSIPIPMWGRADITAL